jgi:hypothetical protein
MGHEQTSRNVRVMSVIPLKSDIRQRIEHVCFVPKADMAIGLKPVGPQVAGRNRQLIN